MQLQVTGDLYAGDGWHTVPDLENQNYPAAYVGSEGGVAGLQGYVDDAGMYGFKQTALYVYRIRGFDAAGHPTAWSQPQSITPSIPLTSGGTIGVGLTAPSPTSIVVSLPEPADGHYGEGRIAIQARGQRQYWADGGYGNYGLGGATSGIGAPIRTTCAGLAPGTTYDVCVYYQEYEGDNVYGDICHGKATITTPGNPGDPAVVPAAPAGLHAVNIGCNTVTQKIELIWQNTSDNEDGFAIERSPTPDFSDQVAMFRVGADVTNFIDTIIPSRNLASLKVTYYYRVTAIRGMASSAATETSVIPFHLPLATAISWIPSNGAYRPFDYTSNNPPPVGFTNGSFLTFVGTNDYRNILNLQVTLSIDPYSGQPFVFVIPDQFTSGTPLNPVTLGNANRAIYPGDYDSDSGIRWNADHTQAIVTAFAKFRIGFPEQIGFAARYGKRVAWAWSEITYVVNVNGTYQVRFYGSIVPSQNDYLDGLPYGAGHQMPLDPALIGYFIDAPYGQLAPGW